MDYKIEIKDEIERLKKEIEDINIKIEEDEDIIRQRDESNIALRNSINESKNNKATIEMLIKKYKCALEVYEMIDEMLAESEK